jgi:hypothetical protein
MKHRVPEQGEVVLGGLKSYNSDICQLECVYHLMMLAVFTALQRQYFTRAANRFWYGATNTMVR